MIGRLGEVVRSAGEKLMTLRGTAATEGVWAGTQLKTPADDAMHLFLVEHLRAIAPDIPVVSEEDGRTQNPRRPARYWLIDPIDGTASFCGGYAGFVTQVTLVEDARPVLGAVYAPALDLFYLAETGKGATLNGQSLSTGWNARRTILIDNYPQPTGAARKMYDALGCTGYLESGSIGLKICRIADGSADVFFKDVTVRDWDIAPAHLVLEEAGGHLCGLDGQAFAYQGSFAKTGLLAAASAELAHAAVARYAGFRHAPV